jgi:hypothetical protein
MPQLAERRSSPHPKSILRHRPNCPPTTDPTTPEETTTSEAASYDDLPNVNVSNPNLPGHGPHGVHVLAHHWPPRGALPLLTSRPRRGPDAPRPPWWVQMFPWV